MNYGKFFRLNKNLSRIEEGYAVYDYIDLPAYFTRSIDNRMSPKYPVSMTVMADSVVFKLHYSAYKIEESSDVLPDQIDPKYPKYLYDIKDYTHNGGGSLKSGDATKIVHMEETILELPYTDTVGRNLSDTIRDIYNTIFPLILNATDESDSNTKKKDSSGGRFLHNLIRKRYLEENVEEERDVHSHFYHSLRRISDGTPSYSTLWLMGLVMGDKDNVRYVRTDKKGNIVGFLRKLLLDFMFDLKHSDVFQNSANYQKMYSGLMSDFYFSALMHKCEYYYYRKLTSKAIDDIDNEANSEVQEERIKTIGPLYATELVKAEDLWIQDIMNPQAEKNFEHQYPSKDPIRRYFREFIEYYSFEQWPSWFAEPEEEMRRVCFTMKDETGERHICNADTLTKYLGYSRKSNDETINKIVELRDDDREQISRWFLKQYAFSDVLHLHLFKHANLFFILFFALPILFSWFSRNNLLNVYTWTVVLIAVFTTMALLSCCIYKYNDCKSCVLFRSCRIDMNCLRKIITRSAIVQTRRKIIKRKKLKTVFFILFSFIFVFLGQCKIINKEIGDFNQGYNLFTIVVFVGILVLVVCFLASQRSVVSVLHLFLPRLVASITLAWITLSMGFDLYVSYFDSVPSIPYIVVICGVVLIFVVYSINLVIPHSLPLRKFLRSLELMIISYFISLSVGFLIINFLGPKYLERGGYITDYYDQHVEEKKEGWFERKEKKDHNSFSSNISFSDSSWQSSANVIYQKLEDIDNAVNDTNSHVRLVEGLEKVKMKNKSYSVAAKIVFWGMDVFVLRDFLIMFAFIAMFTGIFIQLIIFGDNKQMTEL